MTYFNNTSNARRHLNVEAVGISESVTSSYNNFINKM